MDTLAVSSVETTETDRSKHTTRQKYHRRPRKLPTLTRRMQTSESLHAIFLHCVCYKSLFMFPVYVAARPDKFLSAFPNELKLYQPFNGNPVFAQGNLLSPVNQPNSCGMIWQCRFPMLLSNIPCLGLCYLTGHFCYASPSQAETFASMYWYL